MDNQFSRILRRYFIGCRFFCENSRQWRLLRICTNKSPSEKTRGYIVGTRNGSSKSNAGIDPVSAGCFADVYICSTAVYDRRGYS